MELEESPAVGWPGRTARKVRGPAPATAPWSKTEGNRATAGPETILSPRETAS